jgi:hypothetical protein
VVVVVVAVVVEVVVGAVVVEVALRQSPRHHLLLLPLLLLLHGLQSRTLLQVLQQAWLLQAPQMRPPLLASQQLQLPPRQTPEALQLLLVCWQTPPACQCQQVTRPARPHAQLPPAAAGAAGRSAVLPAPPAVPAAAAAAVAPERTAQHQHQHHHCAPAILLLQMQQPPRPWPPLQPQHSALKQCPPVLQGPALPLLLLLVRL